MDKNNLFDILSVWNPWWDGNFSIFKNYILRDNYLQKIRKWIPNKHILIILGIRRSGKSTIMLQTIEGLLKDKINPHNILFINMDDPLIIKEKESENFLKQVLDIYKEFLDPSGRIYIFIDEIQSLINWQNWLKGLYDNPEQDIKFVITGSSANLLKGESARLLTGRHVYFEVYPLNLKEFITFNDPLIKINKISLSRNKSKMKHYLKRYISEGGFPEVVLEKDNEKKKQLLKTYFENILYRDIISRYNLRDSKNIEDIAYYISNNISRLTSMTNIAKMQKSSVNNINKICSFFEEVYLFFFLSRFEHSIKKQYHYPKKAYIIDSGMRSIFSLGLSKDIGRIYENLVFIKLKSEQKKCYYIANEFGEIDFLIISDTGMDTLIQVCYEINEANQQREITAIIGNAKKFNIKKCIIITDDLHKEEKIQGIIIKYIPLYYWLLAH